MIQDTEVWVNTAAYTDLCDRYFESARWIDGSELTEEELEYLENDSGYLYEWCERQLY